MVCVCVCVCAHAYACVRMCVRVYASVHVQFASQKFRGLLHNTKNMLHLITNQFSNFNCVESEFEKQTFLGFFVKCILVLS